MDIHSRLLPVRVVQAAMLVAVLFNVGLLSMPLPLALIGIGIGFLILYLPYRASHGRLIGSGDAWVGAWMGATLGFPGILLGFYFVTVVGGLTALVLVLFGWDRQRKIPFAPILCLALLLALFTQKSIFAFLYLQ